MRPTSVTLCAAIACASPLLFLGPAGAQNTMSSQPDQLSGFVGDGICTGHLRVKPGHPTTGRFHGEKVLGDHWVVVRYDEDATAANSRPYHVVQYLRYDIKAGRFIDVLFDNSGSSYGTGTSSGWQDDAISFDNSVLANGKHYVFRDVFGRHGAMVVSHTGYQRTQSGKWVKADEEICKRM